MSDNDLYLKRALSLGTQTVEREIDAVETEVFTEIGRCVVEALQRGGKISLRLIIQQGDGMEIDAGHHAHITLRIAERELVSLRGPRVPFVAEHYVLPAARALRDHMEARRKADIG